MGCWIPALDKWYYTDRYTGAMVLGWHKVDGYNYYFSEEGDDYGQMVTGLREIDGKLYNFADNGVQIPTPITA